MPLASNNFLLLMPTTAKAQTSALSAATKVSAPSQDGASSFADVYAKQAQNSPDKTPENTVGKVRDQSVDTPSKVAMSRDKTTVDKPTVADGGKNLPAKAAGKNTGDRTVDSTDKASAKAKTVADDSDDDDDTEVSAASDPNANQATAAGDPTLDPMVMLAMTGQMPNPPAAPVAPRVAAPTTPATPTISDPSSALSSSTAAPTDASTLASAVTTATTPQPHTPVVANAAAQTASKGSEAQPDNAGQDFTNVLAGLANQPGSGGTGDSSQDSPTGTATPGIDALGGAKDTSSSARAESFVDKLNALGQAVAPRAASAADSANPPLAMHQSGWTEAVVDRVMYLSALNLKSAEIQLQPAELGKLDVKVNMTPENTQVTFVSAHQGVREALEAQAPRLREMFAQQGLAQPDVNVSDQSRGWQQNQQAQDNPRRGGNGSANGDADVDEVANVSAVNTAPAQIIGSSAVDYFA